MCILCALEGVLKMSTFKIKEMLTITNLEPFQTKEMETIFKDNFPIFEVTEYAKSITNKYGDETNTLNTYLIKIKYFYEWLDSEGLKLENVTIFVLKKYLDRLKMKNIKSITVHGYYTAVVRFVEWCIGPSQQAKLFEFAKEQIGDRSGGMLQGIKGRKDISLLKQTIPKLKREKPEFVSSTDVQKIKEWIKETFEDVEDFPYLTLYQLIFELLLQTGIRKGELLSLKINCLKPTIVEDSYGSKKRVFLLQLKEPSELSSKEAKRLGMVLKTGEREMPITNQLANLILKWKTIRPIEAEHGFLLCNIHPERYGDYFSKGALSHLFKLINNQEYGANLNEEGVYPHLLRHTFATEMVKVLPVDVVQTLMGHSSITSTTVYTHLDTAFMKESLDKVWDNNKFFEVN